MDEQEQKVTFKVLAVVTTVVQLDGEFVVNNEGYLQSTALIPSADRKPLVHTTIEYKGPDIPGYMDKIKTICAYKALQDGTRELAKSLPEDTPMKEELAYRDSKGTVVTEDEFN